MPGRVVSVSQSAVHGFSKRIVDVIELVQGVGVKGDAHAGTTVQHRSRVARDPNQPNLRQVHLIQAELFTELRKRGYVVEPGMLGENICTSGIDLLSLPTDTKLRFGKEAEITVTGLRNPCQQINDFQAGLMDAVLDRDENGNLIRKAGVMAVVTTGGRVATGDLITIELPSGPHRRLERV